MATEIERSGMDMGGPHEQSYYEIALTNRQVVVAFIALLVCLVAAFFSGVWIGRESSTRAFAQLARATPPGAGATAATDGTAAAGVAGAGERPDGQALQEFKFFNDQKKRSASETHPGRQEKGRAVTPPEAAAEATPERQESPRAAAPPAPRPSPPRAGAAGEGEPMPPAAAATAPTPAAAPSSERPREAKKP